MINRIALSFVALVALAGSAAAEVRTSQAGKVSIDVPSGWNTKSQSDTLLTISDPTNEIGILFAVVEQSDMKKAGEALDAYLSKIATDIKWGDKPKPAQFNGMSGVKIDGRASVQGKPVGLGAVFLKTPSQKGLIVLVLVQADRMAAHKESIKAIFNSLKPAA